jgi:hypothetical protein
VSYTFLSSITAKLDKEPIERRDTAVDDCDLGFRQPKLLFELHEIASSIEQPARFD